MTATMIPQQRVAANGGTLRFAAVTGRGTLWIDGKQVAQKADAATGSWEVPINAGKAPREIALILEAAPGERTGLPGVVGVEPK